MKSAFAATAALSFTVLPSALSRRSWQKPVISWLQGSPAAKPVGGQVLHAASAPGKVTTSLATFPRPVQTDWCEDKGSRARWPCHFTTLLGHQEEWARKQQARQRYWGLMQSSCASQAHLVPSPKLYLSSMTKFHFYSNQSAKHPSGKTQLKVRSLLTELIRTVSPR